MAKPRVLVVEDEAVLLLAMERLLSDLFQVSTAANAEDGLALARDQSFDVVVTDYRMPGMDGLSFAVALQAGGHRAPVLVVTGNPASEELVEALRTGLVEAVLPKPWPPVALVGLVTSMLPRGHLPT